MDFSLDYMDMLGRYSSLGLRLPPRNLFIIQAIVTTHVGNPNTIIIKISASGKGIMLVIELLNIKVE